MQGKKIHLIFLWMVFIWMPVFAHTTLTNEELCYLPATELIELFRAKVLSPVDVLKAQIERIESHDHVFNAVTFKHYQEALAQAKEPERRYRNGNPRPLEGLTCALKDDVEVKGWRMTMGSLIRKNVLKSEKDSALTTLLRDAGIIMHIQTNVPEYYCNLVTWNWLFGISRNPWNPIYTPGGSSGGSAAALTAGFSTLATGSDMGGSIRFPAAMTALYGFKPPYGRVASSLTQYESLGPLARNFDDLNLFQQAISGPSPQMISAIRPKLIYHDKYEDIKGWRIAYDPMDKWGIPIDKTVKKAMRQAIKNLEALGAIIEEVDLGFRAQDFEMYARGLFSTSIGHFCFHEAEKNVHLITPYMKTLVKNYAKTGSSQHISTAEDWIEFQSAQIQKKVFLKGFKAIIMPTMCTPYVAADMGSTPENMIVTINGKPHSAATWTYAFTWPWNMLGQYPVINVPIDLTPENIPIGMQIIGNTYDDLAIFQVASNWSKVVPAFYGIKRGNEAWPSDMTGVRTGTYERRQKMQQETSHFSTGATALVCHGANPGLITHFAKQAILDVGNSIKNVELIPHSENEWANLAQASDIISLHISERDTQMSSIKRLADEYVNTWSIEGLFEEASENVGFAWGTHEEELPKEMVKNRIDGEKCRIIELNQLGIETQIHSWVPSKGMFTGFLMPHFEVYSIAELFSKKTLNHMYQPTVHFVYQPCTDAIDSMYHAIEHDWINVNHKRLLGDDILKGKDELGILVVRKHTSDIYWFGSRLDIKEARSLIPYNNATSVQVAAGILSGLIWIIENPQRGLVEPEQVDFKRILEIAVPYLGEFGGYWAKWPEEHFSKITGHALKQNFYNSLKALA